jgi:protein TonB
VAIVRSAAPFGAFTSAMRREADQIVVTSRFRFTREDGFEAQTLGSTAQGRPR